MIELHFVQQCCDAIEYLEMGAKCADTNVCYDPLRPVGALLWFSLPKRLGLPDTSLIYAHLLLLLMSIGLSVFAMRALFPVLKRLRTAGALTLMVSAMAHVAFFVPVLFVSLSDAPSGLLALSGIWIMLASIRKTLSPVRSGITGAMLGIAAWIRVAYLPALLVALVLVLFCRNRKSAAACVLMALLPVLLQMTCNFSATGHFAYLDQGTMDHTMNEHWFTPLSGYDTLLPRYPHFLENNCQYSTESVWEDPIKVFTETVCFIREKAYFNFGSYSWHAFITGGHIPSNAPPVYQLFLQGIQQVYQPDTQAALQSYRYWSHGLLLANLMAIAAFIAFVLAFRKYFDAYGWAACFLIAAWTGVNFIILTEQRFLVAPMTCFWLIGFCYLFSLVLQWRLGEQRCNVCMAKT